MGNWNEDLESVPATRPAVRKSDGLWLSGQIPRSSTPSLQTYALCSKGNPVWPTLSSHWTVKCNLVSADAGTHVTHTPTKLHTCRWPSCGEVSMSKIHTECYKPSFGSVIAVHQLNHEQFILVNRAQTTMWSQANRCLFSTLCKSLPCLICVCVCVFIHWPNFLCPCASSLTQVKCCTPTTAPQVTD